MQQSFLVAVSAAALLWAAGSHAHAADPTRLVVGASVDARLDRSQTQTGGRMAYNYDDYSVELSEGQTINVEMTSDAFDTYLEVYHPGEEQRQPLAFNDDAPNGMSTDSRLRFVAETSGTYLVRARNLSIGSVGPYQLSLSEAEKVDYPLATPLAVGDRLKGTLDETSPVDEDEARFHSYIWQARKDDRVMIRLSSKDFDSVVSLGQLKQGGYVERARNDDGPDHGLDSLLIYTALETGDYIIKAMAFDGETNGDFQISLEDGPAAPKRQRLDLGQSQTGRLSEDSGVGEDGSAADHYLFSAQEGQRIAVTLRAGSFDAFVEVFDSQMQSLGTDDDGGGELNSRLVLTIPATGDYVIEATSLGGDLGSYEVKAELLPPPPIPTPIQFGQRLEGELSKAKGQDDEGHTYSGYVFSGQKDQRIQFTVRSGDFDAMAQIGVRGEEFAVLSRDDDGAGEGLNAQLTVQLPDDGDYEVRALGLGATDEGRFSVELRDLGPEPKRGSLLIPSVARGTLSERDSRSEDGIIYDAYSFKAKADEKLRFTLISPDFDAVLEVGDPEGDYSSRQRDDDGLSDTHSRLDWTAPYEGLYEVRAQGLRNNITGRYVLTVERLP